VATDPDQMSETPEPGEAEKRPPETEAAPPAEAAASSEGSGDATAPAEGAATTPTPSDGAPPKKGRKTAQEQAAARREAKLDAVTEQIEKGGLVIRQMTEEERLKYPPRPTPIKRPGPRSR
jgi:hypothetical protein